MRLSTLYLAIFCSLIGTSLLAKPVRSAFSVPLDTLSIIPWNAAPVLIEKEVDICPEITPPDSKTPTSSQAESLAPTIFVVGDFCGMSTGFIDITPDPNTPGPWTFHWSTGETTEDISGLSAGSYRVTIIDANGNQQLELIDVGNLPQASPTDVKAVPTGNTSCSGPFTGALDITVLPMSNLWMYEWSTGATTQDITGLNSETYTVSITFGVTCTTTYQFTVPDLANSPDAFPPPPSNGTSPTTCERSDGIAGVAVVGGVQPYTYLWSNGATTVAIQDIPAGTYTITVTGANGCTDSETLTVDNVNWPIVIEEPAVINVPNSTCIGGNGSISVPIVHPIAQGPFSYIWNTGATTQSINNLTSGNYTVTVSFNAACFTTEVFWVDNAPVVPNMNFSNTPTTCGFSNGFVNLTILPGGIPPYTYLWSNGATTQDLTNVLADSYDVTVTGSNGCTSTGNVTIPDNPVLFSYSAQVTDQFACDTTNGKIVLSLSPSNLAFQWSNGATTKTLTNLAPGDYTVTISAGGTCTSVETYNVGDVTEYPSLPIIPDTTTCGLANASVDLTVNGGATPFTYLWSNGATTEDLIHVKADTFYVTVTSAVGCSNTNQVIIPNFNAPIEVQGNVFPNLSCTAPSGAIALNVTPFDSSYTYVWSSGQTTDSLSNLSPGNYLVTVTLGNTCIALDTFSVQNDALPPNLSASAIGANCGLNNGAADLSISGGLAPFNFLWSNTSTTEDLSNLTPGTYTVTVTGANSCSEVSTITVLNNNITLNVNGLPAGNTSCSAVNGTIDVSISPTGAYNYAWSNAATTEDLSNLSSNTYTVTVSLGTCLSTGTFTVPDNATAPNLSASGISATCGLSDGSADLSVSGGIGPFSYTWSNLNTTEDITGLPPGNYLVTVTGANSCTATSAATVLNNTIAINASATPFGNTSCTTANGAIDLNVTPAGSYNYMWSNTLTTEDLSNLNSGTFTVTVTYGTCQSTSTFTVADNTASPNLSSNVTAAICSLNNGSIDLNVNGALGPYTYLWSNMATTEDIANLLPGNYEVTVTSPNGCSASTILNVANNASNFSLAGTPAPLTNCAVNNGTIDLNVNPPGAFTYLWSTNATTEDLSGLAPGTYTVSVTQSGSCTATASYFVIDQRSNPLSAQSIVPELCGQSDGSIDLNITGGTAPYGYAWNNGQFVEDLNNIAAGNYQVTVTDANNCTVTSSAVVPGNSISFTLAGTPSSNSSCLQNNGAIDLVLNPGPAGLSFLWSNMATTEDLNGLNAGTYTVTVSAGGNCTHTAVFTINNNVPSPLLAQNITAAFCGQSSGAIDLSVSGSPAPYQYFWSNAATSEDISGVVSNTYSVTVTAANGCTTMENFVVPENGFTPSISSILSPDSSCVINNGAVDLTVNPPMAYTFSWSNLASSEDLSNVPAGTYTVTVSAGGSCTNTAILTVGSTIPLPSISDNIVGATCGQSSGNIDLSVSGSIAPYSYFWSNANTNEDLNALASGNYSVTVTAANGCTSFGNFTVPENTITPNISGLSTAASSCVILNGAIDVSVSPALAYTFAWSNGSVSEDLASLPAGSYTVTINGGGACTNTATYLIADQTTQPVASIASSTTALNCSTLSIALNGSVTGTPNAISTQWLNNGNVLGNGTQLNVTLPGQFDFVVIDNFTACKDTTSILISQSLNPPALNIANPAALTCNQTTQVLNGSSPISGVQLSWASILANDTTLLGAGPTLTVNAPGIYYLFGVNPANNCPNGTFVNVTADQTPPTANAGTAFTLDCAGETAGLQGSGSGAANLIYQWSTQDGHFVTGANNPSPLIDEAGTYTLLVANPVNGCTDTDVVIIEPEIPVAYASIVQPTCLSPLGTLLIDSITGLSAPITYSLNNSPAGTQTQFSNLAPGAYNLAVLGNNGCNASLAFVIEPPDLLEITLEPNATLNLGYSYLLDAQLNIPNSDIASVAWTPATSLVCASCLSTLATPDFTTDYQIQVVSKEGCEARGTLHLRVDRTRRIYAPNIFSPDGDGSNDVFTIYADPVPVVRIKSLQVFSRWGEEIYLQKDFAPGDESLGWDGNFKGQKLNPSVFVWQAVVLFIDGKEELFTGDVTLQR